MKKVSVEVPTVERIQQLEDRLLVVEDKLENLNIPELPQEVKDAITVITNYLTSL